MKPIGLSPLFRVLNISNNNGSASNTPEEDTKKTQISHLPSVLLFSILSRLPLMSLLRSARYTCKLWHSIINDPVFCDSHVAPSPGYLYAPSGASSGLFIVDNSTLAIKLPADISYSNNYKAIHSCHGLISYWSLKYRSICICNPILDDQVTLPRPSKKSFGASGSASYKLNLYAWGFGYATLTKQYKCLYFSLATHPTYYGTLLGKIFTLGEESWRDLAVPQGYIWSESVYCNGTLYCTLRYLTNVREYDIVSFDLNTEKYRLRHVFSTCTRCDLRYLTVFGEIVTAVIPTRGDAHEVWMLVDEAENIWVQKYHFCDPTPELHDVTFTVEFRFSGLWMNQEMYGLEQMCSKQIFSERGRYEGGRLLLYNVERKRYTELKLPSTAADADANAAAGSLSPPLLITHLGSLVSPSKIATTLGTSKIDLLLQ